MAISFAKGIKPQVSIKNMLHQRIAGMEPARHDGDLHASDLLKELEFCPREQAFYHLGVVKKKPQFVGTALRMTFAHGSDMERRLRNEWLRDKMVGYWECQACGHTHTSFGLAPTIKCPKCGCKHLWEYREVKFHSPTSGVSGRIDGLVDVGHDKLRILEIKSIDKDEFKKLAAPLAEHKFRTALYLRLADESHLDESNRVNTQTAHILYVSKSFGFKDDSLKAAGINDAPFSPIKEFIVTRDDSLVEKQVNRAKAYTKWKASGSQFDLPCGVCVNGLTGRAQKCGAVTPCWSGKFMSLFTWLEDGVPRHAGKTVVD